MKAEKHEKYKELPCQLAECKLVLDTTWNTVRMKSGYEVEIN